MDDELKELIEGMTDEQRRQFAKELKRTANFLMGFDIEFMAYYLESSGQLPADIDSEQDWIWN